MAKSVDDYIIDFSKAEEGGGGGRRYKAGTYHFKIVSVKPTTANSGNVGFELNLKFLDGKYKGKTLRERVWASPKALPRLRTLIEACGKKVPTKVKPAKIVAALKGATLYGEVVDDEDSSGKYKTKSVIAWDGFINEDDYDPDAVDDDEDEDEEDEDLEDEEDEEEDEDEEEEDEEEEDEDDEEDEEEEEEEPAPKRRKRSSKSTSKAKSKPKSKSRKKKADDDEDIDDLDLDEF